MNKVLVSILLVVPLAVLGYIAHAQSKPKQSTQRLDGRNSSSDGSSTTTTSMASAEIIDVKGPIDLGDFTLTPPEEWVRHASSTTLRKATFILPGQAGGQDAELVVFHFKSGSGNNLEKWSQRFLQNAQSRQEVRQLSGLTVHHLTVQGDYKPPNFGTPTSVMPNQMLLAAQIVSANGSTLLRFLGSTATVEYWQPQFEEFLNSLQLQ